MVVQSRKLFTARSPSDLNIQIEWTNRRDGEEENNSKIEFESIEAFERRAHL